MVTEEQGKQQFEAADCLEAAVLKGRWKGIVADKLWLIEVEQGITIEVELDKCMKGLRLVGTPDMTDDGQYLLSLEMTNGAKCKNPAQIQAAAQGWSAPDSGDPDVLCQCLVNCDAIWPNCQAVLDALFPPKPNNK